MCVKILCVLSNRGPLNFRQIKRKSELNSCFLETNLGFLIDRGLVEKENGRYFVSGRGFSVLKVLGPLVKEARRIEMENFGAISNSFEQAIGVISNKRKWKISEFIKIKVIEE